MTPSGALRALTGATSTQIFPTVADLLCYLKGLKPKNKIGAAFGSYGWSGEAVKLIENELTEDDDGPQYLGLLSNGTHNPTARVEYALRADLAVRFRGPTSDGTEIAADFVVRRPPGQESLNVVVPWSETRFQCNSKHNTLPCEGFLSYGRLDALAARLSEDSGVVRGKIYERWSAEIPLGRLARPEEFAALVEHILLNPMLNGVVIRLDGGLRMPAK